MASLNKVLIIGNLGRDPEVRATQTGAGVATLNIATSERWNNKQTGQPEERTEWHRVVCFGKLAELSKNYLKKGSRVYVEGRLQTRSWDDKETGAKKYATEVVCNTLQFLDRKSNEGAGETNLAGADSTPNDLPPFTPEDDIPF